MIARPLKSPLYLFIFSLACTTCIHMDAQICINKFSSLKFQGSTFDTITCSDVTINGEIISAGKLFDYNHGAHIAKYSAKGSPVWSYRYSLDFYDFIKLVFFGSVNVEEVESLADGGAIIAGNVEQVLSPWGNPPPVKKWALISRIDRFGRVVWTKSLSADGELNFTNIYKTNDGDMIAYLAADNGYKKAAGDHSYNRVLCIGADGTVKWSTYLFTFLFDAGGLGVSNKRKLSTR